jgi:hypothetical protein
MFAWAPLCIGDDVITRDSPYRDSSGRDSKPKLLEFEMSVVTTTPQRLIWFYIQKVLHIVNVKDFELTQMEDSWGE